MMGFLRRARDPLAWTLPFAMVPGVVTWAAMLGLGVARQGAAPAVALTATMLVFAPAILVGAMQRDGRTGRVGVVLFCWSSILFLSLPLYFPGERRDAVATGMGLLTGDFQAEGVAKRISDALPDEPDLAIAQVPQAVPVEAEVLPPAAPLDDHEIALPYEGEGRRLSVPVVFDHEGVTVESFMMLDTGATYTTLPQSVLARLGAVPAADAPEIVLHTANGERTAKVVLLDRVWLGDLHLDGVAVTTCEDCANDETDGLLGLNVTGAYNTTIDADRREVIFSQRASFNRRLDLRPFADLQARFIRYPGGRVEVVVDLDNRSARDASSVAARVTCDASEWMVELGALPANDALSLRRRLPRHERCETYQIILDDARW